MTKEQAEQELAEAMASFEHDPLGYAEYAFEWGQGDLKGKELRAWQKDLLKYIGDQLKEFEASGTRHKIIQVANATGHGLGKLNDNDCIVPTPQGMRRWGDIQEGEYLFGKDGKPTRIIKRHPDQKYQVYRVHFDDGTYMDTSAEHLWTAKGRGERRFNKGWTTLSTKEIVAKGVLRPNGKALAKQWEIPIQSPVEFPEADLPIHPYLLGVWLGDGHRAKKTLTYTKPNIEIKERIESFGYKVHTGPCGSVHRIQGISKITASLDYLTLGSHERFIPEEYKIASISQRMELLSGLLDTDGECINSGSICFGSTSKKLIDDVIWLARSLGFKAAIQENIKVGKYKKDGVDVVCRDFYRCIINGSLNPFNHKEKRLKWKESEHRYKCRWIAKIEVLDQHSIGHCVTVEAEDSLYLANDFIVTHNSAISSILMLWAMSTKENTRGVVTANTEKQLQTKTWPELSKWYNRAINKHWFKYNATSFHADSKLSEKNWRIDAIPWSIHNTEAFAGLHNEGKRILIIFDEASAIPDIIWEVTEGALTDENTEIIWIVFGNPTRNTGRFRECFRKFKKYWKRNQLSGRGVEGVNQEQIATWDETHGKDSDFVRVRVDGKFPKQSTNQFIGETLVQEALGKHLEQRTYEFAPVIIGVDPAWTGDDELVIVLRQGLMSKVLARMPKNDNDVQVANLVAQYEDEYKADAVFIDLGYGTGIYSVGKTLNRRWQLIGFGEKASKDGFLNKRAEMWQNMKDWLKEGAALPNIQDVADDLMGVETVPRVDGKIQLESKQDMKKRGLPSPNIADALALTFAMPVRKKQHHGPVQDKRHMTVKDYDPFSS